MEVKEVVKIAIDYVADLFDSQTPTNTGLEEITFNENEKYGKSRWGFQGHGTIKHLGVCRTLRLRGDF